MCKDFTNTDNMGNPGPWCKQVEADCSSHGGLLDCGGFFCGGECTWDMASLDEFVAAGGAAANYDPYNGVCLSTKCKQQLLSHSQSCGGACTEAESSVGTSTHSSSLNVYSPVATCTTNSYFRILTGSAYCQLSGACVTDGPGNYGNNEECTVEVLQTGLLSATEFYTESGYDYLTIGGTRYQDTSGPSNLPVTAGTPFSWRSDGSVTYPGWTVCYV